MPSDPKAAAERSLRVLLIHGLEGSPQGSKAVFLSKRFDTLTPHMDTSSFEGSVETQTKALAEFRPDVLVGSSFGGAVAVKLLQQGVWKGPTLLLAQAARHFDVEERLPEGVPVLVVHGTKDDVVDIDGSRRLANTGSPERVRLVEVDDGHRLQSLIDDGRLAGLVHQAASL